MLSPNFLPYFAGPAVPPCIADGLYLVVAAFWPLVDSRRFQVVDHLPGPEDAPG